MSDEILSLIYTFSKKFSDPETNLSFDPKNQNISVVVKEGSVNISFCLLYTSPSPRDMRRSRMPSSA